MEDDNNIARLSVYENSDVMKKVERNSVCRLRPREKSPQVIQ